MLKTKRLTRELKANIVLRYVEVFCIKQCIYYLARRIEWNLNPSGLPGK